MLNSVLIEGVVLDVPERTSGNAVCFTVNHKEELILNVSAAGVLGAECKRLLKSGMTVRLLGKLCTEGLLISHLEFKGRGLQ